MCESQGRGTTKKVILVVSDKCCKWVSRLVVWSRAPSAFHCLRQVMTTRRHFTYQHSPVLIGWPDGFALSSSLNRFSKEKP